MRTNSLAPAGAMRGSWPGPTRMSRDCMQGQLNGGSMDRPSLWEIGSPKARVTGLIGSIRLVRTLKAKSTLAPNAGASASIAF